MMKQLFIFIVLILVFSVHKTGAQQKVFVPKQSNEFVWIYNPAGDYFFGPDTHRLKEGKWYEEWVPNDHCFVKADDGKWHIFGITHPMVRIPPLHEGEFASFHAISKVNSFNNSISKKWNYQDLAKILPPKERPGETLANHAPYIILKDGLYYMVYGYSPIRLAVSKDLYKWEAKGALFSQEGGARDPNVLFHNGIYYMTYCSKKSVLLRTSTDFSNWSEPKTIFKAEDFAPESPSLIFHNSTFYLFVCSWDLEPHTGEFVQGMYEHASYVYQSDNLFDFGFGNDKKIADLNAHAPEIFQGEDGQWYISSVEWPYRGVSIDKMIWE